MVSVNRPGRRLLAVYLVALLGMALLATGSGFVGTAAAAANAPTCDGVTYSGAGTSDDPYEVGNVEQLQCINGDHGGEDSRSDALSSDYELVSDVDASGTSSWNDGKGLEPIGDSSENFEGSLDGNGHEITNVTIDRPNRPQVGLFGFLDQGGSVSDVSLRHLDVTGDDATGGLAGTTQNKTTVSNVAVSGTVSGGDYVGGIAGSSLAATVSNASATAGVTGSNEVGGLIGDMTDGSVTDAVVAGSVTGTGSDVGSVIGLKNGGASLTAVYRDVETAGQMDAIGSGSGTVTELTITEMTGMNATPNMETLSFYNAWVPTKGGYPEPVALAGTDGTTADAFDRYFAGDGTESNPYVITTAPELQAMSDRLDAHYALGTDIDASETSSWDSGKGFEPIGNSSTPFSGSFDGQGHTISDLTINRSSDNRAGLFGDTENATISNVTLAGVDITGDEVVGSLVGVTDGGSVRDVSASGSVNGTVRVGGLVGFFNGSAITNSTASVATTAGSDKSGDSSVGGIVGELWGGDLSNVRASGTVSGVGENAGGVVGEYTSGALSNLTATGNVYGADSVGGLVGVGSNSVTVRNSSATGDVKASSQVGGLVGWNLGKVENSFSTGAVSGSDSDTTGGFVGWNDGGTITETYWRNTTSNPSDAFGSGTGDATALTTAEMTGMNATRNMGNLSFYDTWVPTKNDYPEPASLAGTDGTTADAFKSYFVGDGTEANPYEIETAPELQAMNGRLTANYTLGTDVDAAGTKYWNDGRGFAPVGPNGATPFVGSFDGDGHAISNLVIDRSSSDPVGLFGVVGDQGTVRNVSVSSVDVDGEENVGGVAGDVFEGTVRNVSVSGSVNGSEDVGGLAGYLYAGSAAESASTVTVSGEVNVGGLVGFVYDGNTSTVRASGAVHGPAPGQQGKNVGGLVGRYGGGTIHDASASGNVSGPAYVGGLVGNIDEPTTALNISAAGDVDAGSSGGGLVGSNSGTVRDAFASGAVTGSTTGGLVGRNVDSGTITDAYWDTVASGTSTATGQNDGSVDATDLTTAEMTGAAAADNMATLTFADPWITTDDYPVLRDHVTGLSLDLGTTSLAEGDTTDATVTLSLLGGGTEAVTTVATYTTTDADIADVEAGTLTAAGVGSTTISANHAGGSDSVGVDVSAQNTGGSGGGNSGTADRSDDGTAERTSMAGDGAATGDGEGPTSDSIGRPSETSDGAETVTATVDRSETTDGRGPGFGLVGAVLALLATALLARRRI
mgnify:CR=1 FL=1